MPNSEDVQPPLPKPTPAAAELLDQSSLNTVLDIVEAIETAEELALLETLTSAQKRQVWSAISDEQKLRLKKIRTGENTPPTVGSLDLKLDNLKADTLKTNDLETDDRESDSFESDSLLELPEELAELAQAELDHFMAEHSGADQQSGADQPKAQVGDRVVLLPKPQLTSAELIAIWDVIEIQEGTAQIETKRLGTRHYPLSWMVVYPEPEF